MNRSAAAASAAVASAPTHAWRAVLPVDSVVHSSIMRRLQHCGGQIEACLAQMSVSVAALAVLSAHEQHARDRLTLLKRIAERPVEQHNAVSHSVRKAEQLCSRTVATERTLLAGARSMHERPPILPTAPIRDMLQLLLQVEHMHK